MNYAYNEEKMMVGIRAFRQEAIKPTIQPEAIPPAKPDKSIDVIKRTAALFKITPNLLISDCRMMAAVRARGVVAFVLRRKYGYSLPRIGRALRRHHTTIMHLDENTQKRYRSSESFRNAVDAIAKTYLGPTKRDEMGLPL